jgi:drug/metabolite transporter (DMT)-like permease
LTAAHPHTLRATIIGFGAVLLWSALALLTTVAGPVPPFQMTAMAFALGFSLAFVKWIVCREDIAAHLHQPTKVWALGVVGLFGYHAMFFAALWLAPPVEANLLNYLWPLLIVVFSGFLPGERLGWWHIAGALAGLVGCVLLIGGGASGFRPEYAPGYIAALGAALLWSAYSVLSRRFGEVPTDAVGGFCGATALLAAIAHLLFERTYVPVGAEWLAILVLGLGPVGAAFYLWDHGVKRGDIKALGALSYMTPLLSTLLLVVFGRAEGTARLALACALIVGGAVLAARDLWRPRARIAVQD